MSKTVLITGAARRIGAAIAKALAEAGWGVVLHANRSAEACEFLRGELEKSGRKAWCVRGDLVQPRGPERLFEDAVKAAGGIDAVVNNAAVFGRAALLDAAPEDFEYAWQLNTLVPVRLTQCLARHLLERKAQGSVVNLLDQRIAAPAVDAMPYLLSKKALEAFTASAALELAPTVRMNAVAPGAALLPEAPAGREPAGRFPLERRPTPEEIASAVRYLLECGAVTGQTIFVDGGQHLLPR
jgi:pteridine reductase